MREVDRLADGTVRAEIVANRPSMVVLKATFDPRWRVSVDGVIERPQMVAPSFVGREVPPGVHSVVFTYVPYPGYGWLIGVGAFTLLGLHAAPRMFVRRRRRGLPSG